MMRAGKAVMAKATVAALVLLFQASFAHAAGPRAALNAMEASMLVTGHIEVDQDGRVQRFELDQRARLPQPVDQLLGEAVPRWQFEPALVDGQPAAVRARMRIRVAATRAPDDPGSYVLRVAGASFGEAGEGGLRTKEIEPPVYPRAPLDRGVQGTVYLLLKIGRTGTVEDLVAEQVNLRLIAGERVLRQMRKAFEKAAIHAARDWTFTPPTAGEDVDAPFWTARVPVEFAFRDSEPGYGEWSTYVPGPRVAAPWAVEDTAAGADSFAANEVYLVGKGLKLLTPLEG